MISGSKTAAPLRKLCLRKIQKRWKNTKTGINIIWENFSTWNFFFPRSKKCFLQSLEWLYPLIFTSEIFFTLFFSPVSKSHVPKKTLKKNGHFLAIFTFFKGEKAFWKKSGPKKKKNLTKFFSCEKTINFVRKSIGDIGLADPKSHQVQGGVFY